MHRQNRNPPLRSQPWFELDKSVLLRQICVNFIKPLSPYVNYVLSKRRKHHWSRKSSILSGVSEICHAAELNIICSLRWIVGSSWPALLFYLPCCGGGSAVTEPKQIHSIINTYRYRANRLTGRDSWDDEHILWVKSVWSSSCRHFIWARFVFLLLKAPTHLGFTVASNQIIPCEYLAQWGQSCRKKFVPFSAPSA